MRPLLVIISVFLFSGCIINTPEMEFYSPGQAVKHQDSFRNPYLPRETDYAELDRRTLQDCQEIHLFRLGKVNKIGYLYTIYSPYLNARGESRRRKFYKVLDINSEEQGYYTPNGRTFEYHYNDRKGHFEVAVGQYPHNGAIRKLLNVEGEVSLVELDIDWYLGDDYPNPRKPEARNLKELEGDDEDEDDDYDDDEDE